MENSITVKARNEKQSDRILTVVANILQINLDHYKNIYMIKQYHIL